MGNGKLVITCSGLLLIFVKCAPRPNNTEKIKRLPYLTLLLDFAYLSYPNYSLFHLCPTVLYSYFTVPDIICLK